MNNLSDNDIQFAKSMLKELDNINLVNKNPLKLLTEHPNLVSKYDPYSNCSNLFNHLFIKNDSFQYNLDNLVNILIQRYGNGHFNWGRGDENHYLSFIEFFRTYMIAFINKLNESQFSTSFKYVDVNKIADRFYELLESLKTNSKLKLLCLIHDDKNKIEYSKNHPFLLDVLNLFGVDDFQYEYNKIYLHNLYLNEFMNLIKLKETDNYIEVMLIYVNNDEEFKINSKSKIIRIVKN